MKEIPNNKSYYNTIMYYNSFRLFLDARKRIKLGGNKVIHFLKREK